MFQKGGIMQDKLVIFDLDGTLFRTETADLASISKAFAVNGFDRSVFNYFKCKGA